MIGQNIGAGRQDRVPVIVRSALTVTVTMALALSACSLLFPNAMFGLFTDGARSEQRRAPPQRPRTKAETMMARLELDDGFTLVELKSRYKHLVKLHHPDLHCGDKAAEERLKLINEAYTYLLEQRLYA